MSSSLLRRNFTRIVANVADVCGLARKEFGIICNKIIISNQILAALTSIK